jgi:Uma2 family endonuclease
LIAVTTMPSFHRFQKVLGHPYVPPFQSGDAMDQPTFHELYEATPPGFRAELIGGIVYMPSPVAPRHGKPHGMLGGWSTVYCESTEGTEAFVDTTMIMARDSEPQPDLSLIVYPEAGGQLEVSAKGYFEGAPELAVEIAHSSRSIDLNAKKRDYELYGVREYIVVEAKTQIVHWFVRRGAKFVDLATDGGVFKSRAFPGLWLDPEAIFDRSPKRLLATLRLGLATPEHAKFAAKLRAKLAKRKS